MAAPRKHPPANAPAETEKLAAQGFSLIGLAKHFAVSKDTLKRWLEEDGDLREAFERGREVERQALHAAVYRSAMEGKPANVNAFFLLKTRFQYVEADPRSVNVNVGVNVAPVMVVKDHGTDEEWAVRAAAQQRALTQTPTTAPLPDALRAPLIDAQASPEPLPAASNAPPAPQYGAPAWRRNA
jgi:hypothetical protein